MVFSTITAITLISSRRGAGRWACGLNVTPFYLGPSLGPFLGGSSPIPLAGDDLSVTLIIAGIAMAFHR